jgi:hypothetical protein
VTTGSDRLASALERWRRARLVAPVDLAPGCAYGLVTRESLGDLANEVKRLNDSITNTNRLLVGLLVSVLLAAIGVALRGVFG